VALLMACSDSPLRNWRCTSSYRIGSRSAAARRSSWCLVGLRAVAGSTYGRADLYPMAEHQQVPRTTDIVAMHALASGPTVRALTPSPLLAIAMLTAPSIRFMSITRNPGNIAASVSATVLPLHV